jgi:glycoprotein endo-alpha-1,2-mannosidase
MIRAPGLEGVGDPTTPLRTLAFLLLLASLAGTSGAAAPRVADAPRVAVFFYPWYGNPARDGAYHHWSQNGLEPPVAIASSFYPSRGLYSSGDPRVLAAQMREIREAGADQVITSWWGWGSAEDLRLPAVLSAARPYGLSVAVHVEPYVGRTPSSVAADAEHLRALGVTDLYVYRAEDAPAAEWAALASVRAAGMRLWAQTGLVGFAAAAGFDGVYTYDTLVYGGHRFARLCEQARRKALLCAPSVGPGYDARIAVGDERVKPRRRGKTYDAMWKAALAAHADVVTVTSYNEWHEGSQIEPARSARDGYLGYDGAWGLRGREAARAYIDRTALWSDHFRRKLLGSRSR